MLYISGMLSLKKFPNCLLNHNFLSAGIVGVCWLTFIWGTPWDLQMVLLTVFIYIPASQIPGDLQTIYYVNLQQCVIHLGA